MGRMAREKMMRIWPHQGLNMRLGEGGTVRVSTQTSSSVSLRPTGCPLHLVVIEAVWDPWS